MNYSKLSTLFIALIVAVSTNAQKTWTLQNCINYAYTNNLQIKSAEMKAEISKVDAFQAKTNILPDLNAEASRSYQFGRQVNSFTNTFISDNSKSDRYSLSSNWVFFTGLRNYNNILATQYSALSAMSNIEKEKIDIALLISSAYLNILFKKELFAVAERQKEVTSQQVDRTAKLVEAGSVAKGNLLEIKAQLANENLNATNAKNDLSLAYLNLAQMLDLDSISGFEIAVPDSITPDFLTEIPSVGDAYNEALVNLPHIKSAEYQQMSDERMLAIQKGRRSPNLYLSGNIYTGYSNQRTLTNINGTPTETQIGYLQSNPSETVVTSFYPPMKYSYKDQFNDNISKSIIVGISIPILNRWEVNNSISKAKIQLEESQNNLDQVKQQLYKEVQQSYNDAVSSREKYNAAVEAVNSYKEAFVYTEQKYNVGMVNSVEYNVAKNNYIKAESDLLQAKYQYIFSVKILDFYRGTPIAL
jgi:outer membrane protein